MESSRDLFSSLKTVTYCVIDNISLFSRLNRVAEILGYVVNHIIVLFSARCQNRNPAHRLKNSLSLMGKLLLGNLGSGALHRNQTCKYRISFYECSGLQEIKMGINVRDYI